jgi:hypothetical protein
MHGSAYQDVENVSVPPQSVSRYVLSLDLFLILNQGSSREYQTTNHGWKQVSEAVPICQVYALPCTERGGGLDVDNMMPAVDL